MALYFKTVFLREDMLKDVTQLLTKGAVTALDHQTAKDRFGTFLIKVANNPELKGKLYSHFLYKPAKRFFSFGLLADDNNHQ